MKKEIIINKNVFIEISEDGTAELFVEEFVTESGLGCFFINKEKLSKIRSAIPFETVKPKEEMFNGCDND